MPITLGLGDFQDPLKILSQDQGGNDPADGEAKRQRDIGLGLPPAKKNNPVLKAAPGTAPVDRPVQKAPSTPASTPSDDDQADKSAPPVLGYTGVVAAGKGWTTVETADGDVVTRKGTRAWRNNNPGNIEYGNFAKSMGAVGTDGRFAVFPTYEAGRRAKESLLFNTKGYRGKTIEDAINRYAPPFENDSRGYAATIARAAGVDVTTPMSDLDAAQRVKLLDAMERVEGFRAGSQFAGDGTRLPSAVAQPQNVPVPTRRPVDPATLPEPTPGTPRADETQIANLDVGEPNDNRLYSTPVERQDLAPLDEGMGIDAGNADAEATPRGPAKPGPIVVDENYELQSGLSIGFGRYDNPLQSHADAAKAGAAAKTEAAARAAQIEKGNQLVQAQAAAMGDADRYKVMDADEYDAWYAQWAEENQSTGRMGDFWRNIKTGALSIPRAMGKLDRTIKDAIMGDDVYSRTMDQAEERLFGSTIADKIDRATEKYQATLSPEGQDALGKTVFEGDSWSLGGALSDPDWYLAQIGQSIPGMVATMGAAGLLARGTFVAATSRGLSATAASTAAARTAAIAGGFSEGVLAAGQTAVAIEERINAIPRDQLAQSDAVTALVAQGMSQDEAIHAISTNAEVQGLVTAGVITGIFGGFGDRALAKIIGEGVGGGVVKRIAAGAGRGMVAEGLLEEMPQNVGQTVAENAAMRHINPDQPLTEGVGEAAVSGLAVGGVMGGGMGGAAGAMRPSMDGVEARQPAPATPQATPTSTTAATGPIGRAVRKSEEAQAAISPAAPTEVATPAPAESGPEAPRLENNTPVRVETGGQPIVGTVQGYDGSDVVVMDSGTGEILHVPQDAITPTAPLSPDRAPMTEPLPEMSSDRAFEPIAPEAGVTVTNGTAEKLKPATKAFPTAPAPGQRAILDLGERGQWGVKILAYDEGGTEALIRADDGREIQVPVDRLRVADETQKQIDDADRKANPPVERDKPELTGNRREVFGRTVELPDYTHARLYDLGAMREANKRMLGASQLDVNAAHQPEAQAIADALKISPQAAMELADDYRFRVQRSARNANSILVQNIAPVGKKMLQDMQRSRGGELEAAVSGARSEAWWNALTEDDRSGLLASAGVRRSPKTPWADFSAAIQQRLSAYRPEDDVAPVVGNDLAAHEAATSPTNDQQEPTEAQKEAGNYKKGHIRLGGLDISIENPAGSVRSGTDPDGETWSVELQAHYGDITRTKGADGDAIDVFVRPGTEELSDDAAVFVVDQVNPDGDFDEHKVMLGYKTRQTATRAYKSNYTKGWKVGPVTKVSLGDFKKWLADGDTATAFAKAKPGKKKATAPEHVHNKGKPLDLETRFEPVANGTSQLDDGSLDDGVVDLTMPLDDFRKITDEWARLFEAPGKRTITAQRAKTAPILTVAEAQKEIGKWKAHVRKQAETKRLENSTKTILSLFDYTGEWSKPFEEAGYNVLRFDIQNGQDIMDFSVEYFTDNYDFSDVFAILAACPCTDFASSGSRHFVGKDADGRTEASKELVFQTLRTIEYFRPKVWALENPVGRIENLTGLPPARMSFDPNHFGAPYTKKTMLWGDFDPDLPLAVVDPTEGSKMHKKYGGKSLRTKNARSETPEGFAYAFFVANNYEDMPAARRLTLDYPEASGAVTAALDARISEAEIRDVMESTYANYEYEAARSELARLVAERVEGGAPPSTPKPTRKKAPADSVPDNKSRKARKTDQFAENKLFTADKVDAARARIRAKMSQLNSGIDPELLADGIAIAGAYVEAGIRSFSDFAAHMRDEFGTALDADLLAFWEGTRARGDLHLARRMEDQVTSALAFANLDPAPVFPENGSEIGPFGPVLRGFQGRWREAALELERRRTGDAIGALSHKDVGPIDLVWGKEGNNQSDGYGLSKLIAWHPEVLIDLQGFLDSLEVKQRSANRIQLSREDGGRAGIRLDWDGVSKHWLITSYEFGKRRNERSTDRLTDIWEDASSSPPLQKDHSAALTSVQFADNKLFTQELVDAARKRIRAKATQLNSSIDPELLVDGMTIAGAYVEAGVRSFSQFAKEMADDFGDGIKPYLLSFWEGARNYPGLDTGGMTSTEDAATLYAELNKAIPDSETVTVGAELAKPKTRAPRKGRVQDRTLSGDYGVDHIDAFTDEGEEAKAAFLKDARAYLKAVEAQLKAQGYEAHENAKGKPMKAVSVNEAGIAVSGDVTLTMHDPATGNSVYAHISETALRGTVPVSASGVSIMFRSSPKKGDTYATAGTNTWAPLDLTAGQLAERMDSEAKRLLNAADYRREASAKRSEKGDKPDGLEGRGASALEGIPAAEISSTAERGQAGDGVDRSSAADAQRDGSAGGRGVQRSGKLADEPREVSVPAGGNERSKSVVAAPTKATAESISETEVKVDSAAVPAQNQPANFTITEADDIGNGGAKTKFKNNVAAIRLLRTLEAEKRPAMRQEQKVLAKWVGWGGLSSAFIREDGTNAKGWDKEAKELKELLTADEYRAAEQSTQNAHYTSPEVVKAIWSVSRQLGFKGGKVLEPSVGAGNFLGLMPGSVKKATQITAVELDPITGGIAKNLYPDANVLAPMGFEKVTVPDRHFDLAIGNPPFGSTKLYDPARRELNNLSIHNFFFAKSIASLRPGGVLAMVVTNRFLDGNNAAARELIAQQADLVAAIRLPNNAFLKNAGTEVTTDIVVLRKRADGEEPQAIGWTETGEYRGKDGKPVPLNRYFIDNPQMMLGDFGAYGSMYRADEPALVARPGQDLASDLAQAIKSLPTNIMPEPGSIADPEPAPAATAADVLVSSYFMDDKGEIHERLPDRLGQVQSRPLELKGGAAKERVAGMIRVRDAFTRLRIAQVSDIATDAQVENQRGRLNKLYDGFYKKHGPLNLDVNKRLFREDPTWPQLSALENGFDKGVSDAVAKKTGEAPRAPSAEKAAIFTKRTQRPYSAPTSAATAKDALAQVLNARGQIDMPEMSRLYGRSEAEIVEELGSLIFRSPDGGFETADAYLSGNVKAKLAQAIEAAESDPDFRRNVAALRAVQPEDIEAVDIDVKPGAPWVPSTHVVDFIQHITESRVPASAKFAPLQGQWALDVPRGSSSAELQWATPRASLTQVISAALNGKTIQIYDQIDRDKRELNQPDTDAANEKVARVAAEWKRWIWGDDARRDELVRLYNDTFNTNVLRTFDGSHLSFPGKIGDDVIRLRPHQSSFVWRSIQEPVSLADHTVGAGKTFALITSIMEKRRIGQARKPLLTVPNHLVQQWARDFQLLYPGARVLAATKKDFEAGNRKRLFARIATGDWDVVIVAHSQFGLIGVTPELEAKFVNEQMKAIEASIADLREATGKESRTVKQLAKQRDNLKAKLEKLMDAGRKDEGLRFDELGVDALYVDEFHEFKNLAFATGMQRVAGLGNPRGSKRAADMYIKLRHIREKTGGNVVVATGTPLSNSMAEMYTLQRYLGTEALDNMGLAHFDAWARVFGEVVTDWELSPSGQYKMASRFAKFVNMPELMNQYLTFADVINNDDIKRQLAESGRKLPLPEIKGGKPTLIAVKPSPDQSAYIGEPTELPDGSVVYPAGTLIYRTEHMPKKVSKGSDNMLKVMTDARKAALDMRMIDPSSADFSGSKVNRSAAEMKRIYDAWSEQRGTQLVFIDLSTPKKAKAKEQAELQKLIKKAEEGDDAAQEKLDAMSPDEFDALNASFSVYDDLREKLIALGVPSEEIAFVHDANTDLQKEELFGKVRSGRIRFLFGSTPKMGAGTNVQNRLVALHHLDAPWRPSDLEQRDGRIVRQGNELYAADPENFRVEILRYATEKTLDARQWQGIEAKARFIQQVRKGDIKQREVEDLGGEVSNAAEMKAIASGNPLILEEMQTRKRLSSLEGQEVEHSRAQHRIKRKIAEIDSELASIAARAEVTVKDAEAAAKFAAADFAAEIRGEAFDAPKAFGEAMLSAMRKAAIDNLPEVALGKIGDFSVEAALDYGSRWVVTIKGAREYDVLVDSIVDQDALGLAMKTTNTVRRLAGAVAADATLADELRTQRPKLEKQIAPFEGAEELREVQEKHRNLIDQLKPKAKTDNTAASAEPDIAVKEKRADPVAALDENEMRSLTPPVRESHVALRDWAKQTILAEGRASGNEYIMAIDDTGEVVAYGTGDKPSYSGMNAQLFGAMANPDRRLVVYHNHPSSSSLSKADLSALAMPGIYSLWALGHDGREVRAELTEDAIAKLHAGRYSASAIDAQEARKEFAQMQVHPDTLLEDFMRKAIFEGRIKPELATKAHNDVRALVLARAGIIKLTDNQAFELGTIAGLEATVDAAARQLEKVFYGKANRNSGSDRRAKPFRHVGELATPPKGGQQLPSVTGEKGLAEDRPRYNSRKARRDLTKLTAERILEELRGSLTDWKPSLLATIPLNYFSDLARPGMKAVAEYLRVKRAMDAFRGRKHEEADAVAGDWLKYSRLGFLGKDRSRAQTLADLMHGATLAGADPAATDEESQQRPGWDALRKRYMELPPAGRALYNKIRDAYKAQAKELDEILLENVRKAQEISQRRAEAEYKATLQAIKDEGLTGMARQDAEEDALATYKAKSNRSKWSGKARMTKLRLAFESSRVPAPYFPLARFGNYFVTVRDREGRVLSFSKFEKAAQRDRFAKDVRKQMPQMTIDSGVMKEGRGARDAMDPRIVAELEELLGASEVDPQIMDIIWQRYLETMPDLSTRKRFIHRKGTEGFEKDALRVFSSHMFHAAHQMARAKYGLELQELVNDTFDQAENADDTTRAMILANELGKRHEWVMNPTGSSVAQTMSSMAFVWYLAASPASAMVNLTQTAIMGVPVLAGRFGSTVKAAQELSQAGAELLRAKGSLTKADLPKDEAAALQSFNHSGLIDRTQSHDLAGVGNTGVDYSPVKTRVMAAISWAFHNAEVVNREVTALAAYRMARKAGKNHMEAVDVAHDLTWRTHFDYSNSSRPRFMQNDLAKVALVFRQFNVNMLYRIFRDVHQSIKGESAQAKREARHQLAGVAGMMTLMAGVTGSIGYHTIMGLLGLVFGDDDDPMTFEDEFKRSVVDILGPELGGVVLNGAPGHYLGIALSERIGMPDFWFRSPTRELEGRDEFFYWLSQSLGATVSLAQSMWGGVQLISEGNVARGIEMMAPKAIRDLMKAYRYANEGLVDLRGNELMSAEQIGVQGVIAQAMGFTPASIAETYDRRNALKNAETRVKDKRQALINSWALAILASDSDSVKEALSDIQQFNRSEHHRGLDITGDTLKRSMKTRMRNRTKREDGALISNDMLNHQLRRRLPDRVY